MLIVNKLVKLDVVEKTQRTRDKCIFYIKLTKKGRNIAQLPFLAEQKAVDIIVSVSDDEEIDTFIKKTAKIGRKIGVFVRK